MKPRSNDEWVAALSQDGTGAQSELFVELGSYLHGIICRLVRDRSTSLAGLSSLATVEQAELAHDFVQQALMQIYVKLGEYRGEGAFLSWATTIATRKAGEELRKAHWQTARYDPTVSIPGYQHLNAEYSVSTLSDIGQPHVDVLSGEMWDLIIQTVQADLSDQQRRAFLARFVDDRSNHEIATAEGVTPSVIYQRIHQARLKIRRRLDAAGYALWELE